MLNFRPSYLTRIRTDPEQETKISLAAFAARHFLKEPPFGENDPIFFVTAGATASFMGLELLALRPDIEIYTNFLPFLWHAMEMIDKGLLRDSAKVKVHCCNGVLDVTTGVIENCRQHVTMSKMTFLYSPFAVSPKYIIGHRNKEIHHEVWSNLDATVVLCTHKKLLHQDDPANVIKKLGHIKPKNPSKDDQGSAISKEFHVVIPTLEHSKLKPHELTAINRVLDSLRQKANAIIHFAPNDLSNSVCAKHFTTS